MHICIQTIMLPGSQPRAIHNLQIEVNYRSAV